MSDEHYTVITCEKCGTKLQVPTGKGNLLVTCPSCKAQFSYYDIKPLSAGVDYTSLGFDNQKEKTHRGSPLTIVLVMAVLCLALCLWTNYSTTGKLFPCSHSWTEATCTTPKTCSKCGETEGDPLGHNWNDADCIHPRQCSRCGEISGEPLGHIWLEETDTTPEMCSRCGEMVPKELPENGEVFIGRDLRKGATLTIKSDAAVSYYVKMKNEAGEDVFSFFVRAGETATVDVPSGYYQVFFACGNDWYGTKYLFGNETIYSKDDEVRDYLNYNWEYTLSPVINGNFQETEITADEF